jgi:hypothetical protein
MEIGCGLVAVQKGGFRPQTHCFTLQIYEYFAKRKNFTKKVALFIGLPKGRSGEKCHFWGVTN